MIGSDRHGVPNHTAMLLKTLDSQSAKMESQESMVKTGAAPVLEVTEREVNPVILPAEQVQFHHLPMMRALLSFCIRQSIDSSNNTIEEG